MPIEFESQELTELTPKISVIGVGGAGCNAVANMIQAELQGVDFVVANTDAQSLMSVDADTRIQLGVEITQGLGAGAQPKVGEAAAEESLEIIDQVLDGSHMVFITAGMGGGTGTGASPVIARRAREKGVLTVGVVTKPFHFEGGRRMKLAEAGIKALQEHVDTLIIIPNQNLFSVASDRTTFAEAFQMADEVLHSGVRSITDLMVVPGLINLDFADVRTVMTEMGKAMMGTGEGEGENRAYSAAEAAISNQLLEDSSLKGAKGVIINVTGGTDLSLYEVDAAVNMVREMADEDALIVFGSALSEDLQGQVRVSVVATGIEGGPAPKIYMPRPATPVQDQQPAPDSAPEPSPDDTQAASSPSESEAVPADDAPETAVTAEAEDAPETAEETRSDALASADTIADTEPQERDPAPEKELREEDLRQEAFEDMISAAEALEKKALERAASRSFIADAPMVAEEDPEPLGEADVFRESDYTNSRTGDIPEDEADGQTAGSNPEPEPVPAGNFFQKVTRRFAAPTAGAGKATDQGEAPTADPSSSSSLGGLKAEDRPAPTASRNSDQREIPDFLKRQSN